MRYPKERAAAMGVGAKAHFLQSSLCLWDGRNELAKLVNPPTGFHLGCVRETVDTSREALHGEGIEPRWPLMC
jgi:hypothetical protein